ncbi:hypothetical protein MKZ08_19165 [Viridibacillus sp. FSL R5-0477]|uniref:Uncharacterized protein n=1 Tax=Viridibacillus arenosi FSL R5-213 TaxID=1227360 RepID=W4F3S6_9BACL|nr:hypothetical protein [Viridibacillus arenosi]ETT87154.1 hypothetical protein C176_03358 [Viridibacillus arenosi FSL R5-213]OMC87113.1 hypothetical protein BK137_20880 [Viridibacillus arenosi]
MTTLGRFLQALEKMMNEKIDLKDVGYETIELYRDELDTNLITEDVIKNLPDEVLVSSVNFIDEKGDEYLMIDITLYENSELLSTIWMKNGEVIEEPTQ